MSTFLAQTATDILEKHPELKDISIILPSRRAAVFLRKELAQQITKPVWSPSITTIEDFLLQNLQLEKADQATLIFRLYQSYMEVASEPKENFAEFSQWAHLLLADFTEIDRYLVDAPQLFAYLADVERIRKWDLKGGEMTEMVKRYLKTWELLPHLYRHFYQSLLAEKRVYQGMAYREMATRMDELVSGFKSKGGKFLFIGFNALNAAEEKILTSLYREGLAKFYWDVDDYYFEDTDQEAGNFLRAGKLVRELIEKDDFRWRHNTLATLPKKIKIINAAGNHVQALAAHQAVADFKEQQLEEVAVVLADENLLPVFLNNIPKSLEGLNVTMGLPLKSTPVAGFFTLILEMFQAQESSGRKSGNGHPAFHHQQWDDLLGHSLFKLWSGDALAVEELRRTLRKRNWIYLAVQDLAGWHPEVFGPEMLRFFEGAGKGDLPGFWNRLAHLTDDLHQKNNRKDALLQSLFSFYQLFNRLSDLMATYDFVTDLKTAVRFYRDLISLETLDLKGDPLSGLQVMGMLETRTLDFRNLVITSLNEDVLPKGRSENSLIPFDIKQEFGLPTYFEKDAVFAYHFYRLLQRAENVALIYNGATEGLRSGEPSRFIRQLEYELPKVHTITRSNYNFDVHIAAADEQIIKTPAVMQRLREMASRGFSPTSLTDYINDPVEFYKKRVLNLQEFDEVEEVAGYDTQGNVIHELLEKFYSKGPMVAKPVLKPDDAVFEQSEQEIREQVVELLRGQGLRHLDTGKNLMIREILTGMMVNFLKKEKEELQVINKAGHVCSLLALEEKLAAEVVLSDGTIVKLKGTVDRVDRVGDNIRIIDYKTGFVDPSKLKVKEMNDLKQPLDYNKSLQLMTYSWLYLQNHNGHAEVFPGIISLRNSGSWIMPLSYQRNEAISREVVMEFEEFLKTVFEEIFDQSIPLSKKLLTLQSDE